MDGSNSPPHPPLTSVIRLSVSLEAAKAMQHYTNEVRSVYLLPSAVWEIFLPCLIEVETRKIEKTASRAKK